MDRRRFLGRAALAALAATTPAWLRAGESARFERGLASQPWLAGWKTVGRETLGPTAATLEGRLPRGFAGVLYRNGPAWFDRAGFRYEHWFDGDGMVQAWRFRDGRVSHRARLVGTAKLARERSAGRFLLPAAGTAVPGALAIRNNDDMNTANTAVLRVGERLLALWEGGSATELDPEELVTRGPLSFAPELAGAPFSAHPLVDRDGTIWNFGSLDMLGGDGVLIWQLDAAGRLVRTALLRDGRRGYLHSFAISQRHLIFVLAPYRFGDGAAFFERLRFTPEAPCRVAVVPKDALEAPRWFEVEFGMVYHWADASERDGVIEARAVRHRDLDGARSPQAAAMRGEREFGAGASELVSLRIDLGRNRAQWIDHGQRNLEFPHYDALATADARRLLYAPTSAGERDAPYFNAIAAIDSDRGRVARHRYGRSILAEEHRFVAKPGRRRAGQGWLVGTLLDPARGRSGVAVLDAEHVEDGPLAIAWVPYTVPLGFHGWFHAAS